MFKLAAFKDDVKLTPLQQAACAWPLILVFVGGGIGGACGGGAWAMNVKIMKSPFSAPLRYFLIVMMGIAAGLTYVAIVFFLMLAFPNIFAQ